VLPKTFKLFDFPFFQGNGLDYENKSSNSDGQQFHQYQQNENKYNPIFNNNLYEHLFPNLACLKKALLYIAYNPVHYPNTHVHDCSLSCLDTDTLIQSEGSASFMGQFPPSSW
jgi:hypothetical protein